jgi:hypothetical protein
MEELYESMVRTLKLPLKSWNIRDANVAGIVET